MFDAKLLLERLTADTLDDRPVPARTINDPSPAPVAAASPTPDDLSADWRIWFEERAAIREYDGGQARQHAEAEALQETLNAMRRAGEF